VIALAALLPTAAALAACGGGTADKAGGSAAPVTLRIGTVNPEDRPEGAALRHFAARVARLSGGAVEIRLVWTAAGEGGNEQDVVRLVRRGRLDGGLIATRVWDLDGVTSLQALEAPLLITSQALENRVVTGPLARPLLAGLRVAGVTGLALVPADLLHPFGFVVPLLGPHDYAGATMRANPGRAMGRLLAALGAKRTAVSGEAFNTAVRRGEIDGTWWYFEGLIPGATIATGNVVFFPKVHALVVRTSKLDRLTRSQREALDRAAADTVRFVLRTRVPDAKAATQYCAAGGRIVEASPAQVAALRRAVAPAYAALDADPGTRRLIAAIRRLERETPAPAAIGPCGGAAPMPLAGSRPAGVARIPDGVYRKQVTRQQLLSAGATNSDAVNNYGIETLTIDGDRWRYQTHSPYRSPCSGAIRYAGDRVELTTTCGAATVGLVLDARWTLSGGALRFADAFDGSGRSPEARVLFGGSPWRQIG
jgi:C4-dicarboxylate-binding protein DctP